MLPQRLRTWLWRANAVIAVLAIAIWTTGLAETYDGVPLELPIAHTASEPAAQPMASVSFTELVALSRPFHGWGEPKDPPKPMVVPAPDGCLPLGALACRAWIQYPDGPDLIVLKSKDPVHPELYLILEGQPHKGIAIESIEPVGALAKVTVRRGEETFTYTMRSAMRAPPGRVRIHASRPGAAVAAGGSASTPPPGLPTVKVVPFYDSQGALMGARVTGIRPGSWLEKVGLHRGDVVVGIGRDRVASVSGVRQTLLDSDGGLSIEVVRGLGAEAKRLRLDG